MLRPSHCNRIYPIRRNRICLTYAAPPWYTSRVVLLSDQKKSVENSVNFRISVRLTLPPLCFCICNILLQVPGAPQSAPVAGVLFVNGICKVSFARSDLTQLFDEIQRFIFSIDAEAQVTSRPSPTLFL